MTTYHQPDVKASAAMIAGLVKTVGQQLSTAEAESYLRRTLTLGAPRHTVGGVGTGGLEAATKSFLRQQTHNRSVESSDRLKYALGSISKTAEISGAIEHNKAFEWQRLSQGARRAFQLVPVSCPLAQTTRDSDVILALWVIGLALGDADDARASRHLSRRDMARLATRYRWPYCLFDKRIHDIRALGRSAGVNPDSMQSLFAWMSDTPAQMVAIAEKRNHAEVFAPDSSQRTIASLWPDPDPILWKPLGELAPPARDLLTGVVKIADGRRDILLLADKGLVVGRQGALDATLIALTERVGDAENRKWHESETYMAFATMWNYYQHGGCRVFKGVRWKDGTTRPTPELLSAEGVSTEIDTLIHTSRIVFDIQAKSPRSPNHVQREKTTVDEALKQHKKFAASIAGGRAWAVSDRKRRLFPNDQLGNIGKDRVHLPITVGTEQVHLWTIGAGKSSGSGLRRVLTNLDHVRVVNEFIPAEYRPIYWIDRYAQEHSDLRFIDEIDFLGRWWELIAHDRQLTETNVSYSPQLGRLVDSHDSPIETALAARYGMDEVTGSARKRRLQSSRDYFNRYSLANSLPALSDLVRQVHSVSPEDALVVLRSALGNTLPRLDRNVQERRPCELRGGPLKWALAPHGESDMVFMSSDMDFYVSGEGDQWRAVILADRDRLEESCTTPRFD